MRPRNSPHPAVTVSEADAGLFVGAFLDLALARCGAPHAFFADSPWVLAGYGRIDLFAQYSRAAGASIAVREVLFVPPVRGLGPVALYAVPEPKAAGFVGWLGRVMFPLADGGLLSPFAAGPGEWGPASGDPSVGGGFTRALAARCRLIVPRVMPADDPDAFVWRMRNRDLLVGKRLW